VAVYYPGAQEPSEWTMEATPDEKLEIVRYIVRLEMAGYVDNWTLVELESLTTSPSDILSALRDTWDEVLNDKEAGYEEHQSPEGGGGEGPAYRAEMIEAGRGRLLP
jgi:hypothetical protein